MIVDRDVVAETRVCDARARSQFAVLADGCLAFDLHVGIDDTIATDFGFGADVRMRGVDERDSAIQHQTANLIAAQQIFEFRKFRARIDSGNLTRIAVSMHADFLAIG